MKRIILMVCAALVALVSCEKQPVENPSNEGSEIVFNLSATHPGDTKAVKTGWEENDVIFVFIQGQTAPAYLEMKWDGSSWVNTSKGLSAIADGSVSMRAVYLPFGSGATVSADGSGNYVFSETYYTYYLTDQQSFAVSGGVVTGTFNMEIPENYVQFFIEDASAADGGYTLATDAVIPVGVASIAADGTLTETSDKVAGNDMVGYAYGSGAAKGYLFSGKINWTYPPISTVSGSGAFYFAKTKVSDNSRADYFVTGKEIESHDAIKLPANSSEYNGATSDGLNGKWVPVGSDVTVKLVKGTTDLGTWYTCNYGQSVPEAVGTCYNFNDANNLGVSLPTKEQLVTISENCSWTWVSIHGLSGVVAKADYGFLFLPLWDATGDPFLDTGDYWSATPNEGGGGMAYIIFLDVIEDGSVSHSVGLDAWGESYPVRLLHTPPTP
ncbi:MAG: hypothetical protein J6Y83_00245 [Bacteroidales bacterium]|nr:hypothetical protein [Bacteroidales bacterium]